MAKSSLFNWRQSVSATATISHVDLSFSLVHYQNELQEGNHLNTLLGDASAVWRMKKLRLSAELRNLFNKKNYMETIYSGISTLTDSYHLRPPRTDDFRPVFLLNKNSHLRKETGVLCF
jgi:hypothetical protein